MNKFKGRDLKKLLQNKSVKKTGIIIGASIVCLALLVFAFNFSYRDKILPQTYLGGVNLGGKTESQAKELLSAEISKSANNQVEIKYLDKNWIVKAEEIDLRYDTDESVLTAWKIGRQGDFKEILAQQIKSIFVGNRQLIVLSYDESKLNDRLLEISKEIDVPVQDATIKIENLNPVIIEEKTGQSVDFYKAKYDSLQNFGNLKKTVSQSSIIELKVDQILPNVTKDDTQEALTQVKKILASEITLKAEKKDYVLKPSDLADWLEFVGVPSNSSLLDRKIDLKKAGKSSAEKKNWTLSVRLNNGKVNEFIESISGEINQEPKDAKFEIKDGKVAVFQVSQTGYGLDHEKALSLISRAVLNQIKSVELPIKVTQPEVASDSADTLGITELIGEATTSWRGSPVNRIHNLTLGTQKISGHIVKPGQEFSTVSALKPIDAEAGYRPELVIKNGNQVAPEIGGGLCQVSSTLFRAALNAGMEITEREAHSFRVPYYEPPVGMDATIYDPRPDFKFRNNMDKAILIWGFAGDKSLTFQVFGTKDGRKAEVSEPWVGDFVSPGADVYSVSESMEPGSIRQVERATPGSKASFNYKVTSANGTILQEETFVSKYVPIPNSYFVGPGYQVPAEEAPAE